MRIFLAGSTGVIGREMLPLLIERGHQVVALTRREEEVPRLRSAGAEPAVADVFDAEGLRSVVAKARPEVVVHELTSLPTSSILVELLSSSPLITASGARERATSSTAPEPAGRRRS